MAHSLIGDIESYFMQEQQLYTLKIHFIERSVLIIVKFLIKQKHKINIPPKLTQEQYISPNPKIIIKGQNYAYIYDPHEKWKQMIRKIKREKLHYMCEKKIDKLQQYLFIQMKILFVILLIYLCRNQIIWQSNTKALIRDAGHAVPNTSPYNRKIPQAPDAIWIWSQGWNGPTCQNPIVIQQEIFVESNNPITAYITADNNFTLQVNRNIILNGDDLTKIYQKEFSLKCGQKHHFRITAYNANGDCRPYNPAGLIYAFSQNISSNRCPKVQSIVFQSTTDTVIRGAGRAVENTLPYNKKIPQAPNAKWIWSKGWNGPTCVNPIIVQQEFNVESKNPITVYITADNNFTLYFDGSQILRGDDQLKIYSKQFSPKCDQRHKFKIIAYNNYGDCAPYNPAGLVYAFLQDITSNRCPPLPVYIHSRTTKSHNAPSNHLSKHIHQFNHS